MAPQRNPTRTTFQARRYPVIRAIVDADADTTQTLSDKVGEQILMRIIRGEFPPGTPLNSTELASALGVSRTPLLYLGAARAV